jgi:hypothetical protein
MRDTSREFERILRDRYAAMTSDERLQVVVSMRRTAIGIIESSLPPELTLEERRFAIAKRFYGDELPEAALRAHARYRRSV